MIIVHIAANAYFFFYINQTLCLVDNEVRNKTKLANEFSFTSFKTSVAAAVSVCVVL